MRGTDKYCISDVLMVKECWIHFENNIILTPRRWPFTVINFDWEPYFFGSHTENLLPVKQHFNFHQQICCMLCMHDVSFVLRENLLLLTSPSFTKQK